MHITPQSRGKHGRMLLRLLALALITAAPLGVQSAAAGKLRALHSFCSFPNGYGCYDGSQPRAGLTMDQAGNFYGTATGGARGGGIVFELLSKPGRKKLKYKILYNFCQQDCADGSGPEGRLVIDTAGNLYGATYGGGAEDAGTVFKLERSADGSRFRHSILYNFCSHRRGSCSDGMGGTGSLTYEGAETGAPYDGTSPLYGVTEQGGKYFSGVAYSLKSTPKGLWDEQTLYAFCKDPDCTDGRQPNALIPDGAGNLLGTTSTGGGHDINYFGNGGGVVFKLSPSDITKKWDETVLYAFCAMQNCADGEFPFGIVMDASGNLFGTTAEGGNTQCQYGCGVVYEISNGGAQSVVYRFCSRKNCADGNGPSGPLLMDGSGNLFGTAVFDGEPNNAGNIFELSGNVFRRLYHFCSLEACADGSFPDGSLIMDASGNLYGGTLYGGIADGQGGTIFELKARQ